MFYHLLKNGTFVVLHEFSGPDGRNPQGALVASKDGKFYGVTYGGGVNDDGTVLRLTPAGDVSVLHSGVL